jgi:hypothetical protein
MLDFFNEHIISLRDAAKELPRRRGGKRPHVSCLFRWTTAGCRGVVLESVQIGGTRCTSREALARFFERLTSATTNIPASRRTASQQEREVTQAERELSQYGI